jgi:small subunit ribosomal protein S13
MNLRISGKELDPNKIVMYAIRSIFGIGPTVSAKICSELGISETTRLKELSSQDLLKLNEKISTYMVGNELERQNLAAIRHLRSNGSYRGSRLKLGMPNRGQRSRSNARTARRQRRD